jgi:glutaredoxin 3
MNTKRKIEIFSAGCQLCTDAIKKIKDNSCSSYDVEVLDMMRPEVADRAKKLGVKTVPSVTINGKLAECCTGSGPNISTLKKAGLGKS